MTERDALHALVGKWRESAALHTRLGDDAYMRGRDAQSAQYSGATVALRQCSDDLEAVLLAATEDEEMDRAIAEAFKRTQPIRDAEKEAANVGDIMGMRLRADAPPTPPTEAS